jgi:hypothetical protein
MIKKIKHSKHRKKVQKDLIDMIVYDTTMDDYINKYKKLLKKKYNHLSDEKFIDKTKNIVFRKMYHIQQWDQYIDFMDEIINKKNSEK